MVASEAALILKYFGRAVSAGAKPVRDTAYKGLEVATAASNLERLSEAPKRTMLLAQTELKNDASRMLAFLQMHGAKTSTQTQDAPAAATPHTTVYSQSFSDNSRLHSSDRRYRNAGQTLQMMGFQNVATFSTQHQWLQARANMDMNATPMIRARSGIPAVHST